MTGQVLNIEEILVPDQLACAISRHYMSWESMRQGWIDEKREVQKYVYATDTTKTSNSKLPWSNKTTIPKLCQIRDNLAANYMMSLFPKRKWLVWEGLSSKDEEVNKTKAIENYMAWVIDRNEFYDEVQKLVLDYIDYGNCIATVEWVDRRNTIRTDGQPPREQVGYVGPMVRRICPLDIVLNPTAPDFSLSPKIVRSLISIGEVKEMLERESMDEGEKEDALAIYEYLKDIRRSSAQHPGAQLTKDDIYHVAGFDSFSNYLQSNYVEVLTFYGDIYEEGTDTFLRNHVIKIVDRHKIISKRPNASLFGQAPIYHAGWRVRPDNLWAMGPLDNLVGMQYRIDHLENIKADVFDLFAYPPLEIKGYVEDFTWAPFERIYVGDDGKVTPLMPQVQALSADTQIQILEQKMEEMAGSPKEAMGFRTPGEKTKYEVQRLENAASRIFQNKINQFERQMVENFLNAMLELARRHLDSATIRIFDDELKVATFKTLSSQDLTGNGRLKPIAARHFAEKAQQIQDLSNFYQSAVGQDPEIRVHFSSVNTAKLIESLLDLEDYDIFMPYVRLAEKADAQRRMNVSSEQVAMETMTPSGIFPGDHDRVLPNQGPSNGMAQGPARPGSPGPGPAQQPGPPNRQAA